MIYGYPLDGVHQFTYDWEGWANKKNEQGAALHGDSASLYPRQ
jgi:hypothetical protein